MRPRILPRCLLALFLGSASEALSQPAPSASSAASADPIARLVEAYRSGPAADRINLTFRDAQGALSRSAIIVRTDPGDPSANPVRPPRLRLTLARLDVSLAPADFRATFRGNSTTCYTSDRVAELNPSSIRAMLPSLPIPAVQWAFGDAQDRTSVHPYGLPMQESSRLQDGTIQYTSGDARASLRCDARTGRPKVIELQNADSTSLKLEFFPMEAGVPATWAIETHGRTKVESLSELSGGKEPDLVGKLLPDLGLLTPALANVSYAVLAGSAAGVPNAPSKPVALVVYECAPDGAAPDEVLQDVRAAIRALTGDVAARSDCVLAILGALPLAELKPEGLEASAKRIGEMDQASTPRVLFSPSVRNLLAEISPGCKAACIVVGSDRKVVGVTVLDGRRDDADALEVELAAALSQAAPTQPVAPTPVSPNPK